MPRLLTENGYIPNNLYGNEMRLSMENKNLLAQRGALYVGTGKTIEIVTPEGTQNGAMTSVLNRPTDDNMVLVTIPETTEGNNGLGYKKMGDLPEYKEIQEQIAALSETIQGITVKGKSLEIQQSTWTTATGSNPAGTYVVTLQNSGGTGNVLNHGLGATSNIMVQLMVPNGTYTANAATNNWTVVSTTIDIDANGTIRIYSNIQTPAKVVMMTF